MKIVGQGQPIANSLAEFVRQAPAQDEATAKVLHDNACKTLSEARHSLTEPGYDPAAIENNLKDIEQALTAVTTWPSHGKDQWYQKNVETCNEYLRQHTDVWKELRKFDGCFGPKHFFQGKILAGPPQDGLKAYVRDLHELTARYAALAAIGHVSAAMVGENYEGWTVRRESSYTPSHASPMSQNGVPKDVKKAASSLADDLSEMTARLNSLTLKDPIVDDWSFRTGYVEPEPEKELAVIPKLTFWPQFLDLPVYSPLYTQPAPPQSAQANRREAAINSSSVATLPTTGLADNLHLLAQGVSGVVSDTLGNLRHSGIYIQHRPDGSTYITRNPDPSLE